MEGQTPKTSLSARLELPGGQVAKVRVGLVREFTTLALENFLMMIFLDESSATAWGERRTHALTSGSTPKGNPGGKWEKVRHGDLRH
ncbi:unnamed protein product [Ilex paraguariensis]|uniref:Uncharacterized protein n=1 Tax=Ilex paraguariensis TaxID=185542 RepID=A0ABC8TCA8_9AQUA